MAQPTTTIAEQVAEAAHDGQDFEALHREASKRAGTPQRRDDRLDGTVIDWVFTDGSRIGERGGGWDVLLPCGHCWAGADHQERCPDSPEAADELAELLEGLD
jgi:hypothetical protein